MFSILIGHLCNKLAGVKLGHNGLEHLVGDGGEDTVVVVDAEGCVDAGKGVGPRPEQDPQSDVYILQILRA